MDEKIVWLLVLTVFILIKNAIVPLIKLIAVKLNGKKNNPISLDRLYQAFKDFKETQEKWNEKIEERIRDLEKGRK